MRAQVLAALEESLAAAPEPADVLRNIHTGIARRDRRNRYLRTGFAIATIVVLLILSMASAIPAPRQREPAHVPVGEWKNSINPTWLPEGMVAQEFVATLTEERITYHAREADLIIHLSPDRSVHPQYGQQREIDGRPAVEVSSPGLVVLDVQLSSGRWALIELSRSGTFAQAAIREDAVRIARSLRETGDLRLRTRFAPSYLPTGQQIIGVESNIFTPPGFGSVVCTAGTDRTKQLFITLTNVAVNKDLDQTTRIADIQGRPAYRANSGATVLVAGFHGGTLSVGASHEAQLGFPNLGTPASPVPLSELIKIAEGVQWVG